MPSSSATMHRRLCLAFVIVATATVCTVALPAPRMLAQQAPRAYYPLPVNSITPTGWLEKQLVLQAEGLSGHLSMFWDDISNSAWIGGSDDKGLHERTPYWLNGVVPLAYLLQNANVTLKTPSHIAPGKTGSDALCTEGVDMKYHDIDTFQVPSVQECHDRCVNTSNCIAFVVDDCDKSNIQCWLKEYIGEKAEANCRCFGTVPPKEVNLLDQVHRYIDYVLDHQSSDGWLGPDDDKSGNMYWSKFPILLAMQTMAEAEPNRFNNITSAIMRFLKEAESRMQQTPLGEWSAARGMDFALAVQWMLHSAPQGQEQFLGDLLNLIHEQTLDWEDWYNQLVQTSTRPALTSPMADPNLGMLTHGVNNAQALKSAAVWFLQTSNATYEKLSISRMHNMDQSHGLASGMFCADEHLCDGTSKFPSRGTELCAVVEAMFSYNTMFSVHGLSMFADRAERIAYNALPATWASPRGGDMWNHQYLQALNEINAIHADPHVWATDGPDSELYGLAPNYGCCTANFNQGWPKFVANLVFLNDSASSQGQGPLAAAVGAFAPLTAKLPAGLGTIEINTSYPFEDTVRMNVARQSPRLSDCYVRIPGWATAATVSVNGGSAQPAHNGTMFRVPLSQDATFIVVDLNPTVRLEQWYTNTTVSVHRGALMFSMPIAQNYTVLNTYSFESADYQLLPTEEWRFALKINPSNPTPSFTFKNPGYSSGAAPFNHTNWASMLSVDAQQVADKLWPIDQNSAATPPISPVCAQEGNCGKTSTIVMAPYGGTELRISEFPWA